MGAFHQGTKSHFELRWLYSKKGNKRLAAAILSKFTAVASGLQGARVLSADFTAGRKSGLDVNLGV